jgi:hypothetical protein
LHAGVEVEMGARDLIFSGRDASWLGGSRICCGVFEETVDEQGRRVPIISDSLFRALFPPRDGMPLAIAGYHMSFLRRLLGGPWDTPPYRICLYRNARMQFGTINEFGNVNDYNLESLACIAEPDRALDLGNGDALSRLQCAEVLTTCLLARCRLNMLIAMSVATMPPPPSVGPFCCDPRWHEMPGGPFLDFE